MRRILSHNYLLKTGKNYTIITPSWPSRYAPIKMLQVLVGKISCQFERVAEGHRQFDAQCYVFSN
jgi:hypothetical protein